MSLLLTEKVILTSVAALPSVLWWSMVQLECLDRELESYTVSSASDCNSDDGINITNLFDESTSCCDNGHGIGGS